MKTQKDFANHLKIEMVEHGVSQIDVCRMSNNLISSTVINYVCQGKRPMRVPVAVALGRCGIHTPGYWMQLQNELLIRQFKSKHYYRNGTI